MGYSKEILSTSQVSSSSENHKPSIAINERTNYTCLKTLREKNSTILFLMYAYFKKFVITESLTVLMI